MYYNASVRDSGEASLEGITEKNGERSCFQAVYPKKKRKKAAVP